MKLPKSVKIGAIRYKIKLVPRSEFDHDDAWGVFRFRARCIDLARDLDRRSLASTLLHEILHGVCQVFNIDKLEDEEKLVESLENGLTAVMADNPGLFAAIEKEMR